MRSMRLISAAPMSIIKAICATAAGCHPSLGSAVELDWNDIASANSSMP